MKNEEVIERIRKCLALANGLNATPAEMEAAMGKAKEIAMRHSIDIASVGAASTNGASTMDIERDSTLHTRRKIQQAYHNAIFAIIKGVFEVRVVLSTARDRGDCGNKLITAIHLIGEATDVAIAKEIFPWLENVFENTFKAAVRSGKLQRNTADMNGCYAGIRDGIVLANKREEEKLNKADAGTWAIVVREKKDLVDARVEEEFPVLRNTKSRNHKFNWNAHAHGKSEGMKLNLRQVNGSSLKGIGQ